MVIVPEKEIQAARDLRTLRFIRPLQFFFRQVTPKCEKLHHALCRLFPCKRNMPGSFLDAPALHDADACSIEPHGYRLIVRIKSAAARTVFLPQKCGVFCKAFVFLEFGANAQDAVPFVSAKA